VGSDYSSLTNLRLEKAAKLYHAGALSGAAALYRQILDEQPDNFVARRCLALLCLQSGQSAASEKNLRHACQINPKSASTWSLLGVTLLQLKQPDQALQCLDRALALDMRCIDALGNRAIALFEMQRFDEALMACDEVIAIDPGNAATWCNRGNVLASLRRFNEAVASYENALARRSDFPEAQHNRIYAHAMVLLEDGQLESAEQLLEQATRLNPNLLEAYCVRGAALTRLKRQKEAILCFDRAIQLNPRSVEALSNRATAVLELDDPEAALRGFDAALSIDPRHVFSLVSRGNTFMRLKRYAEALSDYDRALAIEPGFKAAQDNRKIALYGLGRLDRCPPEQLRGLFDAYASNYDDSMLHKLGYRGHVVLRELAGRLLSGGAAGIRILDLGCGTGLVGATFADLARGGCLDGIDVSPGMIEKSRKRDVYTQLILGDIEDVLSAGDDSYDLMVSADTIIYFGALHRLFALVRRRLVPAGLFLLALEAKSGEAWEQTPANRFRHSESYVRSVCAETGFSVLAIENFHIRTEHDRPVEGFALALRRV